MRLTIRRAIKLAYDTYYARLFLYSRVSPPVRWMARSVGFVVAGLLSSLLFLHSLTLGMATIVASWSLLALAAAHDEYMITHYEFVGEDHEPVL